MLRENDPSDFIIEFKTVLIMLDNVVAMGNKQKNPMTKEASRRIQSAADRSGKNQGFKARAMRTAAKKRY